MDDKIKEELIKEINEILEEDEEDNIENEIKDIVYREMFDFEY